MTKKTIILIFVILIASVLRLFNLTNYPSGLNADEAALGYNAYSLIETGHDEHGHSWPVNLESFGDFKPAGYTYILIPFIKYLGLNEFSVRLPSALFGIFAVYLIYKLAKYTVGAEIYAAFVLAVSPWHIHFSRGGWEVNVSTTLILLGVVTFIVWSKSQKYKYLLISLISLILAMYVYQSARILSPIIGFGLTIIYLKKVLAFWKKFLLACILSSLILIPLLISLVTSNASSRIEGVGFFADIGPLNRVNQLRGQHLNQSDIFPKLLHNKITIYTLQFIYNYATHFDGNFLFVNGDEIQRNKVPETGLLYFSDILFVIIGIIVLSRKTDQNKSIFYWLIISPIPAALTFQIPHALRDQNMIIPLSIIVGLGLQYFINYFKKYLRTLLIISISLVYFWQISRYLHEYYIHYPKTYPGAWEYGFKEVVNYLNSHQNEYQQIVMTDIYDQPYILFLFYMKYDPLKFQNNHQLTPRDRFNFSTVKNFDKYVFRPIDWEKDKNLTNTLLVGTKSEIPESKTDNVYTISSPDGSSGFKIVSLK